MKSVMLEWKPKSGTWRAVPDFVSWDCVPQTLDMTVSTARIILNNRNGRYSTKIRTRDEFRIRVGRGILFHGVMMTDTREIGNEKLEVTIHHIDYQKLVDKLCADAYKQLGYSGWKYGSATQIGKSQVGGLRPDQIFLAGIGTHFYVQTFFETSFIVKTFTDTLVQDGLATLTTEVSSGTEQYVASGTILFQEFHNSLIGYDDMPDIDGDVTITITGDEPAGTSLSLDISRDGGSTPVTKVPTFSGGVWTATVSSGEWAATATRNRLAVEVTLNANGSQLSAPFMLSLTVQGDIRDPAGRGDTGLTIGSVETYSDVDTGEDEIGADFSRQNRLQVLQGAVKGAVTDSAQTYPSYYGFLKDGAAYFVNPATYGTDHFTGAGKRISFSVEDGTCQDIKVIKEGKNIINNLMYIGQGLPPYGEITLTADDITGLKNAASIAEYGEIQGTVQEKGIPSLTFADKRARILAKHLAWPQVSYDIIDPDPKLVDHIEVGDRVGAESIRYDIFGSFIVSEIAYKYSVEDGLTASIRISNNKIGPRNFAAQIGQQQQSQNLISQGSMSPPSVSFQDNFDIDHPVALSVWLPKSTIRGVHGYFKSEKFRFYSRGAEEEAAAVATTPGGAAGVLSRVFLDDAVDGDSLNVGGQVSDNSNPLEADVAKTDLEPGKVSDSQGAALDIEIIGGNGTATNISVDETNWDNLPNAFVLNPNTKSHIEGIIHYWNDDNTAREFRWRIQIVQTGETTIYYPNSNGWVVPMPSSGYTGDSMVYAPGHFLLSREALEDFSPGANSAVCTIQVRSAPGSGSYDNYWDWIAQRVAKHSHGPGTYQNQQIDAGVGGETETKNVSPDGQLSASNLTALVNSKLGYREDGGGVGTFLFNDPPTGGSAHAHYNKHEHEVTIPAHGHDSLPGIFEPTYYPEAVRLYVKDYPNIGDNPDADNLTLPFGPFGVRGSESAGFEIPNMDLSPAVRDGAGAFKTGQLIKMWLVAEATVANTLGIGRMVAQVNIDVVEGVE